MQVRGLDHIVLRVADAERSIAWYRDRLGLEPVRVEEWRRGEAPFPSLRIDAGTLIDLVQGAPEGSNLDHFCLVVDPTDLAAGAAAAGLKVDSGPGPRFGARGTGTSVYVSDPDGNTVELRHYG